MNTLLSSFKSRLVYGTIAINFLVVFLAGYSAYTGKIQYDNQAKVTTGNITLILEKNIDGVLSAVDLALVAEKAEAERHLATGVIDKSAFDAHLANILKRIPELTNLRMADEKGDILYGVKNDDRIANVADRDYFIALRDNPSLDMTISKPLLGRVSKKWIIIVARRVNAPDGAFAGVIHGNIALDYFKNLFSTLQIDKHGIITLRGEDLTIITRYPETETSTPGTLSISQEFVNLVQGGQLSASYSTVSKIDGIKRLFSYRKIKNYPLFINCGIDPHDYLSSWYRESAKLLAMCTLFMISTLFAARFLLLAWKERQQSLDRLKTLNENLECRVTFHEKYW